MRHAERDRRPKRWWRAALAVAVLSVVAPVVVYLMTPLDSVELLPGNLVVITGHVRGRTANHETTHGRFAFIYLSTVRQTHLIKLYNLITHPRPIEVLDDPKHYLTAAGTSAAEAASQFEEMSAAKHTAAALATAIAASGPSAAAQEVAPLVALSSDAGLRRGDQVLEVGGRPVHSLTSLDAELTSAGALHNHITVVVSRGTRRFVTHLIPPERRNQAIGALGAMADGGVFGPYDATLFTARYANPDHLDVPTGTIGGPSGGLLLTLGFLQALTPGDLAGDQLVTGTGTIDGEGRVGRIGGIREKVATAASAGYQVFFAPRSQLVTAISQPHTGLTIVGVNRIGEALAWLCHHGAHSPVCTG